MTKERLTDMLFCSWRKNEAHPDDHIRARRYGVFVRIEKVLLLFILLSIMAPLSAFAGYIDDRNKDNGENTTAISFQGWHSQADAKWRISFPYISNAGIPGSIESELSFKKIDSPMTVLRAGGKIQPQFSFDVAYGFGSIAGGQGTDSDRFIPFSGEGLEFSQSRNTVTGDVKTWEINLYYNRRRFADNQGGHWGLSLGLLHYADSLRLTEGVQTVSIPFDGTAFPALGPFPSNQVLNCTYDFDWYALKVGVLRQAALTEHISYAGTLSGYPYISYTGEGYWNLRAGTNPTDFRLKSPNFVQKSTSGYGYEASIGLNYAFFEQSALSIGYRYLSLYAHNGTDTTYFADGSAAVDRLDWVTVARHGAYAEMLIRF